MKFGYFTLSDNGYRDNTRGANSLVAEIIDQAIYAEQIGMNSAWIGDVHDPGPMDGGAREPENGVRCHQ